MKDEKIYQCPNHGVNLTRKRIMYGLPDPKIDHSNVILGGCCVDDDSPRSGYECPVDREAYFLKDGGLFKLFD